VFGPDISDANCYSEDQAMSGYYYSKQDRKQSTTVKIEMALRGT